MKAYARLNGVPVRAETTKQCAIRTVAAIMREEPGSTATDMVGRKITLVGVFAGYEYSDDNARTEYAITVSKAIAKEAEKVLNDQIAQFETDTGIHRGGSRPGSGRKPNASKDMPVRSVLSLRIAPDLATWAEQQVAEGRFRSVGEYVKSLVNRDMVDRQRP